MGPRVGLDFVAKRRIFVSIENQTSVVQPLYWYFISLAYSKDMIKFMWSIFTTYFVHFSWNDPLLVRKTNVSCTRTRRLPKPATGHDHEPVPSIVHHTACIHVLILPFHILCLPSNRLSGGFLIRILCFLFLIQASCPAVHKVLDPN